MSPRLWVLFTLVDVGPKGPKKVSLSLQLASTWENDEVTGTALEGTFPKVSPRSATCSLQVRLWLTDLLAPSVHLWCAAAAVRESAHAVTSPSLVLWGVKWPLNARLMMNAHVWRRKECLSSGGMGTALFP